MQRRTQEVRDARNMGHLPKKATGNKSQPKRQTMWAANHRAIGQSYTNPLELTSHYHVAQMPGMELQESTFSLPCFFPSYFHSNPPFYTPCVVAYWEHVTCDFIGVHR
jgi:hypothetical protein